MTERLNEFIISKDEHTANILHRTLRGLIDPRDYDDFRGSALYVSWLLSLEDVLQEEYYPQRAEAYLRAMESEHQQSVEPGAGGIEFEKAARKFIKDLGWPLRDRLFKIEGNIRTNRKEMDIHTEISGTPTIIEVYTTGAHNSKDIQVEDYKNLYRLATGVTPRLIHLTDSETHCEISTELLEILLDHKDASVEEVPGNHREFKTNSDHVLFTPEKRGESVDYQYEFGEFTHTPPKECVSRESKVEERLNSRGVSVSKPYSELGRFTHALGPTISVEGSSEDHILIFHGGRPDHPDYDYSGMGEYDTFASPNRWAPWLAETTGNGNVTVVKVSDEVDQNILTPRLLISLVQL